jgi:extracellular factor (EF) 3-hydroxypalmitic acid methyl ester biosynthesis protein
LGNSGIVLVGTEVIAEFFIKLFMGITNGTLNGEIKDTLVVGQTSQGTEIHATLLHLTRYVAVFEVYSPSITLRVSEVLQDFKVIARGTTIYAGRGIVRALTDAGPTAICEVTLHDNYWIDTTPASTATRKEKLSSEFNQFVHDWEKFYLVSNEYKVVTADIQTFLSDLHLWIEHLELKITLAPAADRIAIESDLVHDLGGQVTIALSNMFERFEAVCEKIEADLQPAHRAFGQRQLHPHLLCAPFIHRTYAKPLGYPGDYEMINMICRSSFEGASLFAKLINAYLLDQAPAHAVRNRVQFLYDRIGEETGRVSRLGRPATVFNIACGPAREVQNFIAQHPLAERARFRLLDFNDETLQFARNRMEEVKREHHRNTSVELVKNSVQNLLKNADKTLPGDTKYDLIYCSGLYDYLSDRLIKALNSYLYDRLQPGGLLVVGNFAPHNPIRNLMEHTLEWFLIYRDRNQMEALAPERAAPDDCVVKSEPSGSNIFLEIRKPK